MSAPVPVLKEIKLPYLMGLSRQMENPNLTKGERQKLFSSTLLPSLYSHKGYLEFQLFLRTVLQNYSTALDELSRFQPEDGLHVLSLLVTRVMVNGWALRGIAYSNIFEEHINAVQDHITAALKPDDSAPQADPLLDGKEVTGTEVSGEDGTGVPEEEDDDSELAAVQVDAVHNGHLLSPQASCKNWLRLQVLFFEAADTLTAFVRRDLLGGTAKGISIKVIALHHPSKTMLTLRDLITAIVPSFDASRLDFTSSQVLAMFEELAKDYEVIRKNLENPKFLGSVHCEASLASLIHSAPEEIEDLHLRSMLAVSRCFLNFTRPLMHCHIEDE